MQKSSKWLVSAALGMLLTGGLQTVSAKEWTSVNIATEGAYEPWNLTLPNGQVSGFEPELMKVLCDRMKLQCNIKVQAWDGMMTSLNAGKFDVLMDSIVITPERQKVVAFSVPYARTPASFVAMDADLIPGKTATPITLAQDPKAIAAAVEPMRKALDGKTIGIASGTIYTGFIDQYFKDIATVREYSSSSEAILDLEAGRIDAFFDDVTFTNSVMAKPENKGLTFTGPEIKGPIWGEGEALAFRQSDTDLKARFDLELKKAMDDGTIRKLSEKWFKVDLTPK